MNDLHTDFNQALDKMIALKLERYEILMQKEVFELLGIDRHRLKNWVERGLKELRIDHRVYYRYSDLIECIENSES